MILISIAFRAYHDHSSSHSTSHRDCTAFRNAVPARQRSAFVGKLLDQNLPNADEHMYELALKARKTVVIVPLSTSAPAIEFLNVALKGGSVARCEHIRSIDKTRLAEKIGSISNADLDKIEAGLSRVLGMNR